MLRKIFAKSQSLYLRNINQLKMSNSNLAIVPCRPWASMDTIRIKYVRSRSNRLCWDLIAFHLFHEEGFSLGMADFITAEIFDYLPDKITTYLKSSTTVIISQYSILVMSRMYPPPKNKWMYDLVDRDTIFKWLNYLIVETIVNRTRHDRMIVRWLKDISKIVYDRSTHVFVIEPHGLEMEDIFVPIAVSFRAFRELAQHV
jgi:hypothetical protein